MPELPEYLTDQTEDEIRQRMLDALPSDLDKAEGSYIWDSVDPVAIELALGAIWAQEILRRGFASTTFGAYLDLRCEEHGVTRKAAVKATGTIAKGNPLTITGAAGTVVAAGFKAATPADEITGTPSIEFTTTKECTIGGDGTVTVDFEATEGGEDGNVPAGSITVIVTPVAGVTGVTNALPASGGTDEESDEDLLARYLTKVRNPSAGGNKADYINWAGEVAGVGGVSVVPVKYGNGTVGVAVINTDKQPADQTLLDAVLTYIAAPWEHSTEAETMTIGGSGTSVENGQVRMDYNAGGEGTIVHSNIDTLLDKPGIWQARVSVRASDIAGVNDLLKIGVWNTSTGAWAKTSSAIPPGVDAVTTYQANDMATALTFLIQPFYWNGSDHLELRINRLQADTTTTVWVDMTKYRSVFSKDTGDGLAPIGAAVYVEAATPKTINVSADITVKEGYDAETVKAAAEAAIEGYFKEIAFKDVNTAGKESENDVKYGRVYNAILDTEGIDNCENLLLNGAATGVTIGAQEVAIKGTVTFS